MKNEQLLSAFSYISVLFCPFIVPLVVYFAQTNEFVRFHAKRALIGQTIALASLFSFVFIFFIGIIGNISGDVMSLLMVCAFGFVALVSAAISIWSIIMTVLVFR